MKRIETIKEKKEFSKIIKQGLFFKNNLYILYIMKREDDQKQFGIAISNKVGNAVLRNKLKRQTRAVIDSLKFLFPNGFNYIIMIRKSLINATYNEKENSLKALIENIGEI